MDKKEVEKLLGLKELRQGFLKYTQQAYDELFLPEKAKILDIGCGSGVATLELARLTDKIGGTITGIDIDDYALAQFEAKIKKKNLRKRITLQKISLYDVDFPDNSFDLCWEEGVFQFLDVDKSLQSVNRILKPGGILVGHQTHTWVNSTLKKNNIYAKYGFNFINHINLPKGVWWNEYYSLLEKKIEEIINDPPLQLNPEDLSQYKKEISMVKPDPFQYDVRYYFLQKIENIKL